MSYKNKGKECSVKGCDRDALCRTFCGAHYSYWKRRGDVNAPRLPLGRQVTTRPITVDGDIATITVSDGSLALCDAEDRGLVGQWNWSRMISSSRIKRQYICTNMKRDDGKMRTMYLHRYIMMNHGGIPKGLVVDHINGDSRNCCKSNMRVVSRTINCINTQGLGHNNTSGYRGVCWHKVADKWYATIRRMKGGCQAAIWSEPYDDKEEAAHAYDYQLVKIYRPEFIYPRNLNFPAEFDKIVECVKTGKPYRYKKG